MVENIKGYNEFKNFLDTYVLGKNIKLAILDDIDCDGFISSFVTKEYVKELLGDEGVIEIIHNTTHGLHVEIAKILEIYDVIIIVDSSTNEYKFANKHQPTLIIDHHNRDAESIEQGITPLPNCVSLNSKDTEELKSISAGVFSYLLFSKYFKELGKSINDEALFRTACISIYSDIIPVDDTVNKLLNRFLDSETYEGNESQIIKVLNNFNNPVNKTLLSYTVIPLINYSRKSNKLDLLDDLINSSTNTSTQNYWCFNKLSQNRKFVKSILDEIDPITPRKQYKNFAVRDITKFKMYKDCPVEAFKGLIANKVLSSLNENQVSFSGFSTGALDENFAFSCRSKQFPISEFMAQYAIEGGGHDLACGYTVEKKKLVEVFRILEKELEYYVPEEKDILISSHTELLDRDLYKDAKYNEIAFSNLKPTIYKVVNSGILPYHIEGKGKLTYSLRGWGDIQFTGYEIPKLGQSIKIIPTFISKGNYELIVEPIK